MNTKYYHKDMVTKYYQKDMITKYDHIDMITKYNHKDMIMKLIFIRHLAPPITPSATFVLPQGPH